MLRRITDIQSPKFSIPNKPAGEGPKFKPGEVFRGTVVQKYPGGAVLVTSKGRQFMAYTELDLTAGQKHQFEVKTTGPKIELKVLDGAIHKSLSPIQIWASSRVARDKLTGILIELSKAHNLKGLTQGTRQTLKNLQQLFPFIVYSKEGYNDGLWFSRYLLGSGLFWEAKVARFLLGEKNRSWKKLLATDMKGILLSLDKDLKVEGQDHDHLKSLAVKIKQALFLIEQDQFQNLSSIREGLGWCWFIPGLEEEGFRKAEVFVKETDGEKEICFSILLDFTRLGQIEVEVSIIESVIGVKIFVEDMEKERFVTTNLSLLETGLQKTGMTTGKIVCHVKDKQAVDINPFSDGDIPSPSIHLVI